jgi:hypothetical protein
MAQTLGLFRQLVKNWPKENSRLIDENSPNRVTLLSLALATATAKEIILFVSPSDQGCQMVCFQTKNSNLGKLWRVLLWKILLYFMTVWPILRPLEIFHFHLIYFVAIWYIVPRFGILDL